MAVRKLRPITPSQRHMIVDSYDDITASKPEPSLLVKKKYRLIDFKREKHDIEGLVKSIEYDPNRTARIALVYYKDGEKRYIVAPNGLKVGQKIMAGEKATPEIGNALLLRDI